MTQLGRRFGLSEMPGSGISCGKDGAFVGEVPLLERSCRPALGNGSRVGWPISISILASAMACPWNSVQRLPVSTRLIYCRHSLPKRGP